MQAVECERSTVGGMNPLNVSCHVRILVTIKTMIPNAFLQALVNVPALSERTLRRDIEDSGFSTGPEIQVCMHGECGVYVCSACANAMMYVHSYVDCGD